MKPSKMLQSGLCFLVLTIICSCVMVLLFCRDFGANTSIFPGSNTELQSHTQLQQLKSTVSNSLSFSSYLQHQYEQQQGTHDCVYLTLSGQGVEVCEAVPRVLHVCCPLLSGHGTTTQVEPAHRRCQGQFADAKESPGRQQVHVAFSEEAHDPPHQEIQYQSKEDNLQNTKPQR